VQLESDQRRTLSWMAIMANRQLPRASEIGGCGYHHQPTSQGKIRFSISSCCPSNWRHSKIPDSIRLAEQSGVVTAPVACRTVYLEATRNEANISSIRTETTRVFLFVSWVCRPNIIAVGALTTNHSLVTLTIRSLIRGE
jgi:hypothetical protein